MKMGEKCNGRGLLVAIFATVISPLFLASWPNRCRLEEESKNFSGKRCAEVVPPVVTSGC